MEVISNYKYDLSLLGIKSECNIYCIHVRVRNIKNRAEEMISTIRDISWISKLNRARQRSFEARAKRTIEKLVNDILQKVNNTISEEFGEFLISDTAQSSLVYKYTHTKVPLAELLGRKVLGNPGFDFHTESSSNLIVFGEAKYSSNSTPRSDALDQIVKFIKLEKDDADLLILESFVSENAMNYALENKKGYVAAFSLNGDNIELIFKNAIKSKAVKTLLKYPELYLIAIEVA